MKGVQNDVTVKLNLDDDVRNQIDHGPQNLRIVSFLKGPYGDRNYLRNDVRAEQVLFCDYDFVQRLAAGQ